MFRFWLSALVLAALPASFSANTYAVPDTLPKGAIEFTAVAAELTQRFWKNRPDTDRKFYRTQKNDS